MLLYSEKIPKLQRPQQNTKQPNKIITTSGGGMMVSNNDEYTKK